MLRYSKTLSLALLISVPAIAMETNQQPLIVTQTEVTELTATLCAQGSLEIEKYRLEEIKQQKQDLIKKEEDARQAVNKALQNLLAKKVAKEQARNGAQAIVLDVTAKLLAHQNERDAKVKEFAAQAQAAIAKINADLQKQQEDYNKDADKKAKALAAQKEQAEKDQKESEKALNEINKTIEENKKEVPQKSGRWYFLGY